MRKEYVPYVAILIIQIVIIAVGIGLFFFYDTQYKDLVNNPSKLCLIGSCQAQSQSCGTSPFKIETVDGQKSAVCAPPSIFTIPSTSTSSS